MNTQPFVYKLSGCGFKSRCTHLKFHYCLSDSGREITNYHTLLNSFLCPVLLHRFSFVARKVISKKHVRAIDVSKELYMKNEMDSAHCSPA